MGKIGKISPIKKDYDTNNGNIKSIGSSLRDIGMNMFPGTKKMLVPYKEKNGEYRTGLDENAIYIKRLPKAEAEQERERVKALKEELEHLTGLDLSPRSKFYSEMFRDPEAGGKASIVRLYDQPNVYNLSDPQSAITFAWLRVHPDIAPSYTAWEKGIANYRCPYPSQCQFFVDDEAYEAEIEYAKNTFINKAINILENMSPTRQFKVAKLLMLPVAYDSTKSTVYNELNNYIKASNKGAKTANNVNNFINIAEMADENIEIRFTVKEAFDYNIYRKEKGGMVYEGSELIADTEQELVSIFANPKHQDQFLALQKKITTAKSVDLV